MKDKGTFLCLKHQARAMLEGGAAGAIVNVGSVNSFLGFPSGSAYVASKHGLIGLTTSVSADRPVHRLPVLGRGQLHHGHDAHARRGLHADDLTSEAGRHAAGAAPAVHTLILRQNRTVGGAEWV